MKKALILLASCFACSAHAVLLSDFDGGGINFTSTQLGSTPGPVITGGGPSGSFMRLVNDGTNSNRNRISFDRHLTQLDSSGLVTLDFDFRMNSSTGNPADGFGVVFLPTSVHGLTGSGTALESVAERPNFTIGATPHVGVGFDVHPAFGTNDVNVQFNGQQANVNPAGIDIDAGVFHHAEIILDPAGFLTVNLTGDIFGAPGAPINVINNVALPGFGLYDYRVEFLGRTGGLNLDVDIDNIVLNAASAVGVPEPGTVGMFAAIMAGLVWVRRKHS